MSRRIYSFVFAFSLFVVVGYFYGLASASQNNQNMNYSDKNIVSSMAQEQQQEPQQPEGDKRCERPNPNGTNPDVGGTDKNKIGCGCVRKCENGQPTENYEEGKRCKVHCKPDHCDCPNPCKT